MTQRKKKPAPPKTAREAGYIDVGEWGDKDVSGAYAKGTTFRLHGGAKVKPGELTDHIGGGSKQRTR